METPCSIPNQEAKHIVADDTLPYWDAGKVGHCGLCFYLYYLYIFNYLFIRYLLQTYLVKLNFKCFLFACLSYHVYVLI